MCVYSNSQKINNKNTREKPEALLLELLSLVILSFLYILFIYFIKCYLYEYILI